MRYWELWALSGEQSATLIRIKKKYLPLKSRSWGWTSDDVWSTSKDIYRETSPSLLYCQDLPSKGLGKHNFCMVPVKQEQAHSQTLFLNTGWRSVKIWATAEVGPAFSGEVDWSISRGPCQPLFFCASAALWYHLLYLGGSWILELLKFNRLQSSTFRSEISWDVSSILCPTRLWSPSL